ncbi:hypothetical protein HN51_006227 [Arachis hypogaea]|uniref:Pentatricopeptide repeat-containing protein n=2 Tax=Arachis TaxID=3817 RepID=A0A445DBN0_ARAHY|nr:pentatricopeptide repeat-containing protein At5g15300 [Arachis duranensis]XP_025696690.1 pentatricopeptide repeat-containing protein At5g15300 [Arachis hypogaea]QHO10286.1 Pentatricopeptide repeat-containing protein [Arachis hypogaea]RYR60566.1 hypothetical protein Ahy_A04g017620 [Arachis hypogaea]
MLVSSSYPKKSHQQDSFYKLPLIWKKCTNLQSLKQIHASMIVKGFTFNTTTSLTQLLFCTAMCTFGPTIHYARKVFDQIPEPDTFMWTTMIRGLAQGPDPLQAVVLYTKMAARKVSPDSFTFSFLIKACTRLLWVKTGSIIQGKVLRLGFGSNKFVRNSLLRFHADCGDLKIAHHLFDDGAKEDVVAWSALTAGYARRGDLQAARKLFDEMPERDLVSWNVMITGYAKGGDMKSARKLFDKVPERDVVTWSTMISGYVLGGMNKKALELFEMMMRIGVCPNEVTLLSILSGCADLGDLEIGEKIHEKILEMSAGELSILLGNALVDMYAKCGSIVKALEVFRSMRDKDVTSWNSAICGLAFHGHAKESIDLFREMQRTEFCPDAITFLGVLIACSHAGKVDEGCQFFDLMRIKYNIEPNIRHFGCIVDMLGRAGRLKEAFVFIASMKMKPSATIWRTLLGSCKVHGDVNLAKRANEELLKIRRDQSGDYVLMSNVYASQGDWDEAERVRKLMDDNGVRKNHGSSLVDSKREPNFITPPAHLSALL